METIHLKTVDPISQELLRSASRQGLELPWDRFEKLQPQDGFLRLGLSCPFGCMQGPCRIDPFARGPQKGVCGLAADEMVAGLVLRLCLQGTMEALARVPSSDGFPVIRYSPTLGAMVGEALAKTDQHDLSLDDIFKGSALLSRPSVSCTTVIAQALRLSLLTLGFQEQAALAVSAGVLPCTTGYATLADRSIRIGLSGQPPAALVLALGNAVKQPSSISTQLVALGDWLVLDERFVPIACTSGESELLVGSGAIHLLVAGPDCDPGLLSLCQKMNIPLVTDLATADVADIIQRARRCFESRSQVDPFADAPPVPENKIVMSVENMDASSGWDVNGAIALVGGSDTPQLSLGKLPLDLFHALSEKGLQLAGWGDAALWVMKNGSLSEDRPLPFLTLDNRQGPLLAVKQLAAAGTLDRLQGICFTGLKTCLELTAALGMAALGCRVSVATPIPIQGSQTAMDVLIALVQQNGGQLRHFDHPADARELSEWFTTP